MDRVRQKTYQLMVSLVRQTAGLTVLPMLLMDLMCGPLIEQWYEREVAALQRGSIVTFWGTPRAAPFKVTSSAIPLDYIFPKLTRLIAKRASSQKDADTICALADCMKHHPSPSAAMMMLSTWHGAGDGSVCHELEQCLQLILGSCCATSKGDSQSRTRQQLFSAHRQKGLHQENRASGKNVKAKHVQCSGRASNKVPTISSNCYNHFDLKHRVKLTMVDSRKIKSMNANLFGTMPIIKHPAFCHCLLRRVHNRLRNLAAQSS